MQWQFAFLTTTQNVVSSRLFAEDSKEMYKDFCLVTLLLPPSSWFTYKLPNIISMMGSFPEHIQESEDKKEAKWRVHLWFQLFVLQNAWDFYRCSVMCSFVQLGASHYFHILLSASHEVVVQICVVFAAWSCFLLAFVWKCLTGWTLICCIEAFDQQLSPPVILSRILFSDVNVTSDTIFFPFMVCSES